MKGGALLTEGASLSRCWEARCGAACSQVKQTVWCGLESGKADSVVRPGVR